MEFEGFERREVEETMDKGDGSAKLPEFNLFFAVYGAGQRFPSERTLYFAVPNGTYKGVRVCRRPPHLILSLVPSLPPSKCLQPSRSPPPPKMCSSSTLRTGRCPTSRTT